MQLSLNLQFFCRNDGSPGLVAVTTGISQTVGLFIIVTHYVFKKGNLRIKRYKLQGKLFQKIVFQGLPEAIAKFSTPVTTLCMNRTLMAAFGDIGINAFAIISYLSSFTMSVFFGASEDMQPLWEYCWGFIVGSIKTMMSAYFYSTKRSGQVIALNIVRSLVMNSLIITMFPELKNYL